MTEDESFALLREETVAARAELEALRMDADRVSRSIETGLLRAVKTGRFGFEDLKRLISSITDQVARSALHGGLDAVLGRSGGLATFGAGLLQGALGFPGRATGGPVAPGQAYLVGERGPELFVPTSSGQVMPGEASAGREVRVSITINGHGPEAPRALARSARQVARAVRGALGD